MKTILGLCGSLRKNSYNLGLLKAAEEIPPPGCRITLFPLHDLPLFNQDHESSLPQSVIALKEAVQAADFLLFALCEYNYSFSGVLKNAIDWGSRPSGKNVWSGKRGALMGASPSMQGTSRAQYHFRQVCAGVNLHLLLRPELFVSQAHEKFDPEGRLTDAQTREQLRKLLLAFFPVTG